MNVKVEYKEHWFTEKFILHKIIQKNMVNNKLIVRGTCTISFHKSVFMFTIGEQHILHGIYYKAWLGSYVYLVLA